VQPLSIFLLKEEARTPTQILTSPGDLKRASVGVGRRKIGDLYVRQTPAVPPRWLKFFGDSLSGAMPKLFNASNGAALVVEAGGRTFALCFGQGRHLLAPGAWEENFGLRVTLNSVDPKRLRSVDRRTFDAYTSHTRTQTSIEGDVSAFGLNVEQDLLRAATGQPLDSTLGRRMSGMDSLAVAAAVELDGLRELLERYLERFQDDSYRQAFPWVDHIGEVREPQLQEKLDQELLEVITETGASSPRAWLAVPSLIDWSRVEGFTYSAAPSAQRYTDLEIRDFLEALQDPSSLSIERLKLRRVHAIGVEEGQVLERWPVYGCLYAEIERDELTYLLTGGRWYRVERDFVKAVHRDVKRLVASICSHDLTNSVIRPSVPSRASTRLSTRWRATPAIQSIVPCRSSVGSTCETRRDS